MFDFGNHLRMLRERYGISQEELGRRVGRAGSVISNYENNIKIPTLDVLTTMARIYNVSLDYLVGFDKKDQVILEGMTDGQRDLIHRLVKELKESTKPKNGGLSADQQERDSLLRILQRLMQMDPVTGHPEPMQQERTWQWSFTIIV